MIYKYNMAEQLAAKYKQEDPYAWPSASTSTINDSSTLWSTLWSPPLKLQTATYLPLSLVNKSLNPFGFDLTAPVKLERIPEAPVHMLPEVTVICPFTSDGYVVGDVGAVDKNDIVSTSDAQKIEIKPFTDDRLLFKVPDWGYDDLIRERASWQKGIDSVTGEMGWFYFKIFFQFDTNTGLLGGILGEDTGNGKSGAVPQRGDCAIRYLEMNSSHYTDNASHMAERATALKRFAATLSYINSKAPWFFTSIDGLDKASSPDINQPLKTDHTIELGFRPDAIDMRVTTLLDLYKYAAFDYINMKEVIPQNLRQFDMTIVLFHAPIRWYHTGMQTMKRGTFQYKRLSGDDRMSYKMYTFKGCELDRNSLSAVYPSSVSNEAPFNLGNAKIKINYKRVYQHTFNEWGQFLIGDSGTKYEKKTDATTQDRRMSAIQDAKDNPYYFNKSADIFKALVDVSESKITWAMRQVLPSTVFGNLYPTSAIPSAKKLYSGIYDKSTYHASTWANIAKNIWDGGYATDVNTAYYKDKLKKLKHGVMYSDNPDIRKPDEQTTDYGVLSGQRSAALAAKTKKEFDSMANDIAKLGTYENDSSDDMIIAGNLSGDRTEYLQKKIEKEFASMADDIAKLGTYENDSSDDMIIAGPMMTKQQRAEMLRKKTHNDFKKMHDRLV